MSATYHKTHVGSVAVVELLHTEIRQPAEAADLGEELLSLLSGGDSAILLDCHRVLYMASTGFAVLLSFAKAVKAQGGEVRIAAMHPDVRVGADILRLGQVIPIHDDRQSALSAFAAA
jgi:anti-anti-sigma factor